MKNTNTTIKSDSYEFMHDGQNHRWVYGYAGHYSATADGQIFSHRYTKAGSTIVEIAKASNSNGRRRLVLCREGLPTKSVQAALVVVLAWYGPIPDNQLVRHLDDDPANDHISNLAYGTRSQNSQDAIRNGKIRGLTPCDLVQMRTLRTRGLTLSQIGENLGVSGVAIWKQLRK